jgi:uncharacterized membrane protein SpoIIM required for sporulation
MPEAIPNFVARRRERWQRLDTLVGSIRSRRLGLTEIEELDRLYRAASSDLALARAFYPQSDATVFLNQLCGRAYGALYRKRTRPLRAIRQFYSREFPALVWSERRSILVATLILAAGFVTGAVSVLVDPDALGPLIPPSIHDAIVQKSMWTDQVLSAVPPLVLSTRLLTNNIGVAFACFAGGILAGVGTAAILFINGLMLGGVITLCAKNGLGYRLFSFAAAHGVVEVSSVLIAGAAGLLVASALISPGELSRADALRLNGRRAVRIAFGTVPLFAAIGLIEGFVSPGDLFPGWLRIGAGLGFGMLLWSYLFVFGRTVQRDSGVAAVS